ncbi:MAG: 50S ribosomal protein L17 [Propionibacteriaceae bacterium]|jgi:large subunit ribosomal protein L17|nr:50S ribosomal protein L17 [Propionibacteriaceae bacterium]
MPKPTKGPRIGGSPSHERIIMANLASQLFEHGKIATTETRAKRMQPLAEHLITKAKRGDLAARRLVAKTITNKGVLHVLFTEIAPAMAERSGGYTRVTKTGQRKGDAAAMAIIEIITDTVTPKQSKTKPAAEKSVKQVAGSVPTETAEAEVIETESAAEVAEIADTATVTAEAEAVAVVADAVAAADGETS